jgi:hypothetical protein
MIMKWFNKIFRNKVEPARNFYEKPRLFETKREKYCQLINLYLSEMSEADCLKVLVILEETASERQMRQFKERESKMVFMDLDKKQNKDVL